MDELKKYIEDQIKLGYILEDGTPVKCYCGHKDFEMVNEYGGEHGIEEYELKCKKCGEIVGTWAYGHWQII